MDWYFKGGLIVGLIWGAARALGVYGEESRDLDISFVYGFLLTTGGWAALFFVIDRVAKFFGWKRVKPVAVAADGAAETGEALSGVGSGSTEPMVSDAAKASGPTASSRPRRTARRSRR